MKSQKSKVKSQKFWNWITVFTFIFFLYPFTFSCNAQVLPAIGGMMKPMQAVTGGEGDANNIQFIKRNKVALNVSTTDSILINYPPTGIIDDVIFAQIVSAGTYTYTLPDGWNEVYQYAGTNVSFMLMWKRADTNYSTSDQFTLACNTGNVNLAYSVGFRNCISTGTPYDNMEKIDESYGSVMSSPAIESFGSRYVALFLFEEDNTTTITGAYYSNLDAVNTTVLTDAYIQTKGLVAGTETVPSDNFSSWGIPEYWGAIVLTLIAEP